MDFELLGKKAIVSAGGSGIGYTVVEEFIKQGVSISTCDIDENLVKELRSKYPQINSEVVDVGDERAVKEFCIRSIEFFTEFLWSKWEKMTKQIGELNGN